MQHKYTAVRICVYCGNELELGSNPVRTIRLKYYYYDHDYSHRYEKLYGHAHEKCQAEAVELFKQQRAK